MIIDSLTIAGLVTFVGITALLILMSRDAIKHGDFRTRDGGSRCDRFCD